MSEHIADTVVYGDGALRGMHRTAVAQSDVPWPAHVVASLVEEVIRLRGRDNAWLATHPDRKPCGCRVGTTDRDCPDCNDGEVIR